jgi:hypothetical protein
MPSVEAVGLPDPMDGLVRIGIRSFSRDGATGPALQSKSCSSSVLDQSTSLLRCGL